jgi:SpoVK/Ycf46/Vps4 family AAA+-type ATPase
MGIQTTPERVSTPVAPPTRRAAPIPPPPPAATRDANTGPESLPVHRADPHPLARLDTMIGLVRVKEDVRRWYEADRGRERMRSQGIATPEPVAGHFAFLGPPGTGKSTLARDVGEMSRERGLLPSGHVVEVGRADLVAPYIGQTAPLTLARLTQALGGVLFIDEAYSLTPKSANDFSAEAISTLVQFMSAHEGELSVVFAGYRDEVERLFASNPGLAGRITRFTFEGFTHDQIMELFDNGVASRGLELDADAHRDADARFLFSEQFESGFAHARSVDAFITAMADHHLARIGRDESIPAEQLRRVIRADIPAARELGSIPDQSHGGPSAGR